MAASNSVAPISDITGERWHGALKETINIPADKAWAISGDFCALNKWMKTVDKCETIVGEYNQPGCVRYMVGNSFPRPDGSKSWAKERLLSRDEQNYSFSYEMLDNNFGFKGYICNFTLQDLRDGTTAVDWAFSVSPIEGRTEEKVAEYMTGVFKKCLRILEDLVHNPSI
ncbi:unnamed protein product [Calypogeia fissa]